jgi:hypothetical protein
VPEDVPTILWGHQDRLFVPAAHSVSCAAMALRQQACHPYHAAPALHHTPGTRELQVGAIDAGMSAAFDDIEALAAQSRPASGV